MYHFDVWRFVGTISWSKSGLWFTETKKGHIHKHLFSIHLAQQEKEGNQALAIILGRLSFVIGIA